ncbi:DASH family cryptochrome [Macromonas nakdongensis]|uniref:DASH family cryptochrome n=1 Tax=Macromonas nakdongensis TaxID=1843082 RepID=UPI000C322F7C|nr:DASH family cryptochrome [Macromonas nakdongensis]
MNGPAPSDTRGSAPAAGGVIHWFRQDLRLGNHPALHQSLARARQRGVWWLPVFVYDTGQTGPSPWGFERMGPHRRAWWQATVDALAAQLQAQGHRLLTLSGPPSQALTELVQHLQTAAAQEAAPSTGPAPTIELWCEDLPAPEEEDAVAALRHHGLTVHTVWQSTLLDLDDLPFAPAQVPDTFTQFRQAVERAGVPTAPPPLGTPTAWPAPAPDTVHTRATPAPDAAVQRWWHGPAPAADTRSSFPAHGLNAQAGEAGALAHLAQYHARRMPHRYKATRNHLHGVDASSKWSPWLATGALSPRQAMAAVRRFEAEHGANDGSHWLWFELLWRDHFRLLHLKHGRALYRARGLGKAPPPPHDPAAFQRWCTGTTGKALVDAGMRELAATGWLGNRLRQIVASYLVHDLQGDWRAGAAWFEAQLIDHDVFSNHGNWLYIAGRGTDPRGGRRFNPVKQTLEHDPDGDHRRRWGTLP